MNRILHVHIRDEAGTLLADIDASSTADALAYFLRSRRIDVDATELSIRQAVAADHPVWPISSQEPIVVEGRCPIMHTLEWQYLAEVGP
jgi:hypothetical protein